jgi:hypothetical protein
MINDLERAIDRAAEELVAAEPSRALSYRVMARVRHGDAPRPRRLPWTVAAASVVLCAAIASVFLDRAPQNIPLAPMARPFAVGAPATIAPPILMTHDVSPATRNANSSVVREAVPAAALLPFDVSPFGRIEPDPISVAAIDVLQIEREAPASIEPLTIDELTIEPLAASND